MKHNKTEHKINETSTSPHSPLPFHNFRTKQHTANWNSSATRSQTRLLTWEMNKLRNIRVYNNILSLPTFCPCAPSLDPDSQVQTCSPWIRQNLELWIIRRSHTEHLGDRIIKRNAFHQSLKDWNSNESWKPKWLHHESQKLSPYYYSPFILFIFFTMFRNAHDEHIR